MIFGVIFKQTKNKTLKKTPVTSAKERPYVLVINQGIEIYTLIVT